MRSSYLEAASWSAETAPGAVELLLYGGAIALATGPFDQIIQQQMMTDLQRALVWGMVYAGFAMVMLAHPRVVGQALHTAWPLFTLAALAVLSTVWSDNPLQTLVASLEMTASTLFGAVIGCRLNERQLLGLCVAALALLAIPDLIFVLTSPAAFDINGDATGLFSHKNMHGGVMSVTLLAATAALLWGPRRLPALLAAGLALTLLALSGSRTAWLATAAAIGLMLFLCLRPTGRLVLAMAGILLACVVGMVLFAHPFDFLDWALEASGKDSTLTGRTVLWDLALSYTQQAPLLGHGFNGFWTTDPTGPAGYVDRVLHQDLPHFHNGYLEMAVELGWVGTALACILMLAFIRPLHRLFVEGDRAAAGFGAALLLIVLIGNIAEVMLFVRHGFHVLMVAALWSRANLKPRLAVSMAVPRRSREMMSGMPVDAGR